VNDSTPVDPDIPCIVIGGQNCGVVRGATTGKRLYHFECALAALNARLSELVVLPPTEH
jgi:hypothetical protein